VGELAARILLPNLLLHTLAWSSCHASEWLLVVISDDMPSHSGPDWLRKVLCLLEAKGRVSAGGTGTDMQVQNEDERTTILYA
jgi:hypothetical protein